VCNCKEKENGELKAIKVVIWKFKTSQRKNYAEGFWDKKGIQCKRKI